MAYTDAQYNQNNSRYVVGTPNTPINLGTATASGTNSLAANTNTATNGTYLFPAFKQPTRLSGIRVFAGTIPANFGSLKQIFLSGTNTLGTATVGSMTAGQELDVVLASDTFGSTGALTSPTIFAAAGQVSMVVDGTSTASGQSLGSYAIEFESHDWFTV